MVALRNEAKAKLEELVRKHDLNVIAIGNGTACRETEELISELITEKLPDLALFWFSSDSPMGGTEWGFVVDVRDVARMIGTSLLVGAYFALWARARALGITGPGARVGQRGGALGALVSIVGLSTGPCSVMGCGAPVLPVVGLAFVGLSSTTLAALSSVSTIATAVVVLGLGAGVAVLGWRVGAAAALIASRTYPSARSSAP